MGSHEKKKMYHLKAPGTFDPAVDCISFEFKDMDKPTCMTVTLERYICISHYKLCFIFGFISFRGAEPVPPNMKQVRALAFTICWNTRKVYQGPGDLAATVCAQ